MNVGERMKLRRKELKMSADAVAEKIGVDRSTIFRYEKGEIEKMPTGTLVEISKALHTTPGYLMGWENDINVVYDRLNEVEKEKVYNFAEYRLKEQESKAKESNVHYLQDYGAVSAGTGELLQEENPIEVEYIGEVPQHDFTVTVNGASMEPVLQHGERLFITATSAARVGQIVIASVNGEAFVKKLGQDRLISLNKDYKDIEIDEHGEAKIIGIVVL